MKKYIRTLLPLVPFLTLNSSGMESIESDLPDNDYFWSINIPGERLTEYKRSETISSFDEEGLSILEGKNFLKLFPNTKTFTMNTNRMISLETLEYYTNETVQFSYDNHDFCIKKGIVNFSYIPALSFLTLPKGEGPFPCTILLHGSEGLDFSYIHTAESLAEQGIAAFFFDRFFGNFTTNSDGNLIFLTNTLENQLSLSVEAEIISTISAIKLVQSHPRINMNKIGFIGWSRGGNVSLECSLRSTLDKVYPAFTPAFSVNYYTMPFVQKAERPVAPTLFLHGANDDYTPIQRLAYFLSRLTNKEVSFDGAPHNLQEHSDSEEYPIIKTIVYPNAGHGFDTKKDPILFDHFRSADYFIEQALFSICYKWNEYMEESMKDTIPEAMNLSDCCVEMMEDGTGFRSIIDGKTGTWKTFPEFVKSRAKFGVSLEINPKAGREADQAALAFIKESLGM